MRLSLRLVTLSAALGLGAGLAGTAFAQQAPPPPPSSSPANGGPARPATVEVSLRFQDGTTATAQIAATGTVATLKSDIASRKSCPTSAITLKIGTTTLVNTAAITTIGTQLVLVTIASGNAPANSPPK